MLYEVITGSNVHDGRKPLDAAVGTINICVQQGAVAHRNLHVLFDYELGDSSHPALKNRPVHMDMSSQAARYTAEFQAPEAPVPYMSAPDQKVRDSQVHSWACSAHHRLKGFRSREFPSPVSQARGREIQVPGQFFLRAARAAAAGASVLV